MNGLVESNCTRTTVSSWSAMKRTGLSTSGGYRTIPSKSGQRWRLATTKRAQ
jgi:hypothetical protein